MTSFTPAHCLAIHRPVNPLTHAMHPAACRATLITLLALCVTWLVLPSLAVAQSQAPANDITTTNPPAVNVPVQTNANSANDISNPALANLANETSADVTSRWPMRFEIPQGLLTVYQPQLTDFQNNTMTGRAAVSIKTPDADEPVFGAIWLASRALTDRAARTVKIIDVKVERVRMPDNQDIAQDALGQALTEAFEREPMKLTLDQLIAMVERVKQDDQAVKDLSDAPPTIKFINNPAALVQFDGEPRFSQTDEPNLLQAVNTPYFVVLDKQIKRYYLKGAGNWYIARDVKGPYLPLNTVPVYVSKLAKDTGYIDPDAALGQAQRDNTIDTPAIIVATEPTELVWTIGPEELSPIENTNLLYVTNTNSDIILDIDTQKIYLLLSGRWYRSSTRTGPWEFVAPDKLPVDFTHIPTNSDKGTVLAHVADTQMAKDALADNYVPQTASIDRANYEQPRVQYDGEPRFEQVERMRITYAVNSPNAVLRINGTYYVCYNAVWYQSNLANGPWVLSTSVPREVYLIPPTSPVYPVRYVRIYEVTPTVVYTGYLPGYVGSYVHNGVVVYGTGYHYRPWVGRHYYPRPYTWGFTPRYDPYHSYWGFSAGVNINFGNGVSLWFGASNRYVASRATWFGYGGYRPVYIHPRHHNQHINHNRFDHHSHNQAYRSNYRSDRDRLTRQPSPRRADLNLYERRRDVVRTHTPGKPIQNRHDRAQRIEQAQRTGGLTAHEQRLDRNNNGRVDRQELPTNTSANQNRNDRDRNDRDRNDQNQRTQRADRNDRTDRNDRADNNRADSNRNNQTNRTSQNQTANRDADTTRRTGGLTSHEQRLDRNNDGRVDRQERAATTTNNNNDNAQRANTARNDNRRNSTTQNNISRNDVFADQDGNVYRKTIDGWERRDRNQWVPGNNPSPVTTSTSRNNTSRNDISTPTRSRTIITNNGRSTQNNRNSNNSNSNNNTNNSAVQPNQTPTSRYIVRPQRNSAVTPDAATSRSQSNASNNANTPARTYTPNRTITTNPTRATTGSQQRSSQSTIDRNTGRQSTINQSSRNRTTVDINKNASLNADYRARIMGEQRQTIYNRTATPAQRQAQPTITQPKREPAARSSRTTTTTTTTSRSAKSSRNSSSTKATSRNEAQSAEQTTPGRTYTGNQPRKDSSNDSRGRNGK